MLHLSTITKENWVKAISLRVREDQTKFVASNAVSLAQLNFLENFHAKGIYHGEEMIGFTLYGIDEDDHEYWIYRMMIDQKHQRKGYGLEAIKLVIEDIKNIKENPIKPLHCLMNLLMSMQDTSIKKWDSKK
jgi:diamine N-acetyltransferase